MAWMYQIAHNAGVDSARKQHASIVDIDDYEDRRPEFASSEPGPEEAAVRNQDLELLGRALDLLPEDKREVLVLSRFQGMKYEDIAAVLRCEVATVKVRVHRAVRALEQLFLGLQREKVS